MKVVYEFGVDIARECLAWVVGEDAYEHYGLILHGRRARHCEGFANLDRGVSV